MGSLPINPIEEVFCIRLWIRIEYIRCCPHDEACRIDLIKQPDFASPDVRCNRVRITPLF